MRINTLLCGLAAILFASISKAVDPSVTVYVDHVEYKNAKTMEFDIMMKASGATSSFQLRTFQAGLYVNPAWVNSGALSIQNVSTYTEMSAPGYNGVFQWNATDKLVNCSVNFDVYTSSSICVSTSVSTTPIVVTRLRLTNTADFTCTSPDIKFNYVSNVSPLRLRTSFSWREVACTTNYDMFYPGRTYGGTAVFNGETYTSGDADGKSPAAAAATTGFCDGELKLTAFLQGYYAGGGQMQSVLVNQFVEHAQPEQTDTIEVELRAGIGTFSTKTVLGTNGTAYVIFPTAYIGQSCDIVIKHRNSIQTWSASPVVLTSRHTYNFASSSSASFADNVISVDPGTYAFYSGDMNQDEFIDIFDFPDYDNDNQNFVAFAYVNTDLNGDGFVDIFDFPIFDSNNQNFIFSIHP